MRDGSLDYLIRPQQQRLGDRDAEGFGGLKFPRPQPRGMLLQFMREVGERRRPLRSPD